MNFAAQMISTLGYLQELGISHLNVKPQNILVQINNRIPTYKLADFEYAIIVNPRNIENMPITTF